MADVNTAISLSQGVLYGCACAEVLSTDHAASRMITTSASGVCDIIRQILSKMTTQSQPQSIFDQLINCRILRELLQSAWESIKFVQSQNDMSTNIVDVLVEELTPCLPAIVECCRTLRMPSKREFDLHLAQLPEDADIMFDRYSDLCRAFLAARWGAQSYCSLLAAALHCENQLIQNPTAAIEECTDAFEIVSEESVHLVCRCLDGIFTSMLPTAECTPDMQSTIIKAIEQAWKSCNEVTVNTMDAYHEFIRMAFSRALVQFMADTIFHQELFDKQLSIGLANRPHSLRILVGHMCGLWTLQPLWMIPYMSNIIPLLIYKEPDVNDAQAANLPMSVVQSEAEYNRQRQQESKIHSDFYNSPTLRFVVRFVLLHFLETLHRFAITDRQFAEAVQQKLVIGLLELSNSQELTRAAMIGTEEYNQKLRIWQALCVLARYVDENIVVAVNSLYWPVVKHICAHGIRFHVETFGCSLALRFPEVVLPTLFDEILCFSHKGQIISSMFIMLGYSLVTAKQFVEGVFAVADYTMFPELTHSPARVLEQLPRSIRGILPYLGSVQGFTRVIAQLLLHEMLKADPRIIAPVIDSNTEEPLDVTYVREAWRYLQENTEMRRVREKQAHFFETYQPLQLCSLAGLALVPFDEFGELCPVHLLTVVSQALKDVASDIKESEDVLVPTRANPEPLNSDFSIAGFQRKIVPFDALQLEVEEHVITRSLNELGRRRQQLIVCASLIDKVPNLAGLARTCEIFALQKLTIPNKTIAENDQFKSIAVSAQDWVPIEEVKEEDIIHFLRDARKEGYMIVGLEQTGESKMIQDAPMESKMVLVLGKEKEGIPVDILHEVDYCIEIPQFGVTRSLNVHVSAALAIWEYTRKQMIR